MSEQDIKSAPAAISVSYRYEQLLAKEFKATIPQHLLAKLPEDERFLVENMSKLESQSDWMLAAVLRNNHDILSLDVRAANLESSDQRSVTLQQSQQQAIEKMEIKVSTLWDWKLFLSGKWAVLTGLALMVLPILFKYLFELAAKGFKLAKP